MEKVKPESDVLKAKRAEAARIAEEVSLIEKIEALVPSETIKYIELFDEDIKANDATIRTQKEATKVLVDANNVLKETKADIVKDIREMLVSKGIDEAKIGLAYPEVVIVEATKATKSRTKGGPTKEERVFDAIKGGMNTKKALEADDAGFGGDVHGQTFTLVKKGLIKATSPGVYEIVG